MLRVLRALAPHLLALLPWAWVLWPLLTQNQFYLSEDTDTLQIQYPLHHLLGQAFQEGQLPMWSSLISNGFPVLAEGEVGGMHPLNLFLFRYLSPYNAYQVAMALAPLLSLVTAYYYLRYRRHSLWAALLGASCFAMSGFTLGHLRHLTHLQAMSMLPLALLFAERYLDRRGAMDAVLVGAALAGAFLAGIPQIPYLIGLALVLLVMLRAFERPDPALLIGVSFSREASPRRRIIQALLFLPGAAVLAGLLAAPQLILTWDLIPFTERVQGLTFDAAIKDSLGWNELIHFIAPHAHGIPAAGTYTLTNHFWETLGYVGLLPLVLAALTLLQLWPRRRQLVFPVLLTLLSLVLALGPLTPLYGLLWNVVPGFNLFRVPGRFLLLTTLGLAMLAAAGLDMLTERLEAHPHPIGRRFAMALPALVLAITGVDLGFHGSALLAWVDQETVLGAPETVASIPGLGGHRLFSLPGGGVRVDAAGKPSRAPFTQDPDPFRARRALLYRNYNIIARLPMVGTYLALPFAAHRQVEARLLESLEPLGQGRFNVNDTAFNLLNFLDVRVLMTYFQLESPNLIPLGDVEVAGVKPAVKLYGIENPFPRAYLARQIKRCDPQVAMRRLEQGRFGSGWAPCGAGGPGEGLEAEESSGVAGFFKPTARGETFHEWEVELLNPGVLVVRDSFAPGWHSYVDGFEVETHQVDLIYRAFHVPKGKHTVRQEYRPRGMSYGLALNLLGLLVASFVILANKLGANRPDLPADPPGSTPRGDESWYT